MDDTILDKDVAVLAVNVCARSGQAAKKRVRRKCDGNQAATVKYKTHDTALEERNSAQQSSSSVQRKYFKCGYTKHRRTDAVGVRLAGSAVPHGDVGGRSETSDRWVHEEHSCGGGCLDRDVFDSGVIWKQQRQQQRR